MKAKCPIFRALKRKATEAECYSCPFNGKKCPEDIMDDAVAKVLEVVGVYMEESRNE